MRKRLLVGALLMLTWSFTSHAANGQIVNGTNKAWIVRNHEEEIHPKTEEIAFKLRVLSVTDGIITAELLRYDDHSGGKYSKKKFGKLEKLTLTGTIDAKSGNGQDRKKDTFYMGAVYPDGRHLRVVTVQGYYHTGKTKNSASPTPEERADDRICFRFRDKAFGQAAHAALTAPGRDPGDPPCDEEPPDEDVGNEEDSPGDEDPSYDG